MSGNCETCGEEYVVVRDDEKAKSPHKQGNPYARYCPNCKRTRYCSKEYWESQEDQYVLPKGSDTPTHYFDCPKCGEGNTGFPNACQNCGVGFDFGETQTDEHGVTSETE